MSMDIYVLDRSFNVLDVISVYESILWKQVLNEPGTFKAEFVYTDRMNRHLQRGNLLYKTDEDEPAVITRKYLRLNKDGEQFITIKGYMASRYTHQRIIWKTMVMRGTPEQIMYQMVREQIVEPEDESRRMPNVVLGEYHGYAGDEIEKQISYRNLQESLTEVSKGPELGYRMRLDLTARKLIFEVYQGEDRTLGTEKPCIFSRKFQNIYTQEYSEDDSNYGNVCLVGGPGEGSERVLESAGRAEGLDRYEIFYNASGFTRHEEDEAVLRRQLVQKGNEKLAAFYIAKAFESKINKAKSMEFALGDFVTCMDEEWGIMENTQVKSIQKGYSKTEQSFVVTFGDDVPTLVNLMKAKE